MSTAVSPAPDTASGDGQHDVTGLWTASPAGAAIQGPPAQESWQVWTPAVFRLCLLAVCLVLSEATRTTGALPWLAVLLLLAGLTFRKGNRHLGHALLAAEIALTCLGVSMTGEAGSPLLVYLLAPGLAAGLRFGQNYTVVYAGEAAALLVAGRIIGGAGGISWQTFAAVTAQWVVLTVAMGVLADRIRNFSHRDPGHVESSHEEALLLLGQLRDVTRRLPGSLDPVLVADAVLDRCAGISRFQTAAVLVHAGEERLAPLATRGMQRVPWRHPLNSPGPLQRAWSEVRPVLDIRAPDANGRRAGSALLALPMCMGDKVLGLVVLESRYLDAFPEPVITELDAAVSREALRLGTAVVFDEFRTYASTEERERLAREMHDGVGQDLASIGFELDELKHLMRSDEAAAAHLGRVREHVTGMVRDIRLSINELQSGELLSRGLGAALTSHVRAAGAGGGFTVHLSLDESTFRLPGDTEAELLRICQEVTAAARRHYSANNLWVTLVVDPPAAILRMEHDGQNLQDFPLNADLLQERVGRVGGQLQVETTDGSRVVLQVTLGEKART